MAITFSIYRSDKADGEYIKVAEGIDKYIGYIEEEAGVWYYRIATVDNRGESPLSDFVRQIVIEKPKDIVYTEGLEDLTLQLNLPTNASSFKLESSSNGIDFIQIYEGTNIIYKPSNITHPMYYRYIAKVGENSISEYSNILHYIPPKIEKPYLIVTQIENLHVELQWIETSKVDGYDIYMDDNLIDSVSSSTLSYVIDNQKIQQASFKIVSKKTFIRIDSNIVNYKAIGVPQAPIGINYDSYKENITISWKTEPNVFYTIYYLDDITGQYKKLFENITKIPISFIGKIGKNTIKIAANNISGEGNLSEPFEIICIEKALPVTIINTVKEDYSTAVEVHIEPILNVTDYIIEQSNDNITWNKINTSSLLIHEIPYFEGEAYFRVYGKGYKAIGEVSDSVKYIPTLLNTPIIQLTQLSNNEVLLSWTQIPNVMAYQIHRNNLLVRKFKHTRVDYVTSGKLGDKFYLTACIGYSKSISDAVIYEPKILPNIPTQIKSKTDDLTTTIEFLKNNNETYTLYRKNSSNEFIKEIENIKENTITVDGSIGFNEYKLSATNISGEGKLSAPIVTYVFPKASKPILIEERYKAVELELPIYPQASYLVLEINSSNDNFWKETYRGLEKRVIVPNFHVNALFKVYVYNDEYHSYGQYSDNYEYIAPILGKPSVTVIQSSNTEILLNITDGIGDTPFGYEVTVIKDYNTRKTYDVLTKTPTIDIGIVNRAEISIKAIKGYAYSQESDIIIYTPTIRNVKSVTLTSEKKDE